MEGGRPPSPYFENYTGSYSDYIDEAVKLLLIRRLYEEKEARV